jgi:hypothetical protein
MNATLQVHTTVKRVLVRDDCFNARIAHGT